MKKTDNWGRTSLIVAAVVVLVLFAVQAFSQEVLPTPEPTPATPTVDSSEHEWTVFLEAQIPGAERYVTTYDGRRCDLVWAGRTMEIDWSNKWAQGVGQSLGYADALAGAPVLILLKRSRDDETDLHKAIGACRRGMLELWVYDCKKHEWTRRGPFHNQPRPVTVLAPRTIPASK